MKSVLIWAVGGVTCVGLAGCSTQDSGEAIASTSQAAIGNFVISGVVSTASGPVQGATVRLQGSETRTAFSDSQGRYSIPGLGLGSYQLSASAGNACATSGNVNLNNLNSSATVNLGLTGTG